MENREDVRTLLGRNIKRYRKHKGLSQEQLSEILGVSVKHLSTIENGSAFVSSDLLQHLAETLDVAVYLLFYDGPVFQTPLDEEKNRQLENIIDMQMLKTAEALKKQISGIA